jgi:hypothetical protein
MRVVASIVLFMLGIAAVGSSALGDRVAPGFHQPPKTDAECKLVPVDASHVFVAAGAMAGDTLTSVQLEDPNSTSTVIRVRVNLGGGRPITVLLQAQTPVVWDFDGNVSRVVRALVVGSGDRRAGVRGLSASQVEFPDMARCRAVFPPWNATDDQRNKITELYLGRAPERAAFEAKPNSLTLPQTTFANTPKNSPRGLVIVRKGDDGRNIRSVVRPNTFGELQEQVLDQNRQSDAESDLVLYHPGGFRQIEASSMLSPVPVLSPETFPGEAGLIQLENAGAIRPARRSEINEFVEGASKPYRSKLSPNYRIHAPFDYVVTREIMLPAGLYGAQNKSFLVLSGVPTPRGNVGHGCLAFMDGFRMSEHGCRGDMRHLIDKLRQLPPANGLEACRMMNVPSGAALHAVSAYQPEGAKHSGNSARVAAPIDVKVRVPGPVVLVLNTYEPAIWSVSFSPDTQIVGVILSGYYTSSIDGIHPDTPVVKSDSQSRHNRARPAPECAPFADYLGTPFNGGPAAMLLDRQVQALTGRTLDGLQGAYKLKEVEVR